MKDNFSEDLNQLLMNPKRGFNW